MWQEKLDALESRKPSMATQRILDSLAAMATRIDKDISCKRYVMRHYDEWNILLFMDHPYGEIP